MIHGLLEEPIQFQALPQLQTQPAGAELARSFQTHLIQQHARDLRIAGRRLHIGGEQLELLRLTLLIEDLDRFQPACLCRTVQLTEIAEPSLSRSVRRAHRFHQRPVDVILAVLAAPMLPQKHSQLIVSWTADAYKRVGLHYIADHESVYRSHRTCTRLRGEKSLELSK